MPANAESAADVTALIQEAFPDWHVAILREIGGGHSGARVFVVDLARGASPQGNASAALEPGQYVLKIDRAAAASAKTPEATRHQDAQAINDDFSRAHIPALRSTDAVNGSAVLLYEIAGQSLANFVVADTVDAGSLRHYCALIARDLLSGWNQTYTILTGTQADATLRAWLGHRLDPANAPHLHAFVEQQTSGQKLFQFGGRVLANPLWLATSAEIRQPSATVAFGGQIHGDLHAGNVLVDRTRQQPDSDRYWIIDFALSKNAPVGFDHAYFELGLLLGHLQGAPPQRILSLLEALEAPEGSPEAHKVAVTDLGILDCVRALRAGIHTWETEYEPKRHDSVSAQMLLARIAVGLNWVNKPIQESRRRLALAYAGDAAARYLSLFARDSLERLIDAQPDTHPASAVTPVWSEVWDQLGRFDDAKAKYVLVTGRLEASDEVRSLALTPWSAVVDLDSSSSETGLHAALAPTLARVRSLNQYGREPINVDFDRGTAWFMANGWPSRFEPVPVDFRRWRREYGDPLRRLGDELRRSVAPLPVKVVVLATPDVGPDYLRAVVAMMDESLEDSSDITLVGSADLGDSAIKAHYRISPDDFVRALHQVFGGVVQIDEATIPGKEGQTAVSPDQLRNLEEDLAVLHSRVIEEASGSSDADSFWRGSPPTWLDLHANADVRRDIAVDLARSVRDRLEQRGNYTLELHHPPGAGGTTAALRCAWDIRRDFPVAVLRRYSATTADRVDQLFRISQKPILLVAEAAVLPSAQREELYREIARRNARCVILYVVRRFGGNGGLNADDAAPPLPQDQQTRFVLPDPLDDGEAARFLAAFLARTTNPHRIRALHTLTHVAEFAPYRNPFLYGLTTYEDDFESVDRYVTVHLDGISDAIKRLVRLLALVTRYTQTGISVGLLNRLAGLEAASDVDLSEALGASVAHLTVQRSSLVRLLHPVIGGEVLKQTLGGTEDWHFGLRDVSIDLIEEIIAQLGQDADEARRLLAELFIKRDYWTPGVRKRRNFSELILAMESPASQHQVLQTLAERCPEESHFWNHLGRHHIYEMKQDFPAAEAFLKKAIELDPQEQVHHHSLGMVRRFWIRSLLAEALRSDALPSPAEMFRSVETLLVGAAEEFELTRRLSPEDNHGYITHIQLIVEVLENLTRVEPTKSVVTLSVRRDLVGSWVRRAQVEAEGLLAQVRQMRQQRVPSRYELRCVNGLAGVYGDFDALIGSLEQLVGTFEDVDVRRALATAYYSRSGRIWGQVPEHELRRTKELMEDNLRSDPTQERDVRTWFQASRRLPEFSYIDAIGRLEGLAKASDSVDAHYYLYILHFLRWQAGAERDESSLQISLENCRRRLIGRRGVSYEWLATRPDWCPLVHANELGDWVDELNFFPNTEALARANGIIATIKPQAGTIKMGTRTVAYFVPGTKFSESRHLNAAVEFYLGFSYEGLRAWSVEFAAGTLNTIQQSVEAATDRTPMARPVVTEVARRGPDSEVAIDNAALQQRVEAFVSDLLTVAENRGQALVVASIGWKLTQKFGAPPVHERLGYKGLEALLASFQPMRVTKRESVAILVRAETTGRAASIADVGRVVRELMSDAEKRGVPLLLSAVGNRLLQRFGGQRVYRTLGFRSLRGMLETLENVAVDASGLHVIRKP